MFQRLISSVFVLSWLTISGCQMMPEKLQQTVLAPVQELIVPTPESRQVSIPDSPEVSLLKDEQWQAAEELLRKNIVKRPSDLVSRTNLGILLAKTQRADAAKAELEAVLQTDPGYCPALLQLASIHLQRFEIDAAENAYHSCLAEVPDQSVALLNLGILHELYQGDLDRALKRYELYQKVARDPDVSVGRWITDLNRRIAAGNLENQFAEAHP